MKRVERSASILGNNEKKLKEVECLYSSQFEYSYHYTTQRLDSLLMFCEKMNALVSNFAGESDLLRSDVANLKRCIGFWGELKANRHSRRTLTNQGE